jgi:hypothetical protein
MIDRRALLTGIAAAAVAAVTPLPALGAAVARFASFLYVVRVFELDCTERVEIVEHPALAGGAWSECWSVYGHCVTGGVDCFEDFETEAEAKAFAAMLRRAYPHLGAPQTRPLTGRSFQNRVSGFTRRRSCDSIARCVSSERGLCVCASIAVNSRQA